MGAQTRIPFWKLAEMVASLVDGWWNRLLFGLRSWFMDEYYYPIDLDQFCNILQVWREKILPKLKYRYDTWDCDDFAEYFASWAKLMTKTNAIGMGIGILDLGYAKGWHAWNLVLLRDGKHVYVDMVEPQLGTFVPKPPAKHTLSDWIRTGRGRTVKGEAVYKLRYAIW